MMMYNVTYERNGVSFTTLINAKSREEAELKVMKNKPDVLVLEVTEAGVKI